MTTDEAWDYLNEVVGISEQTLKIVTTLCGYSMDTMESILYADTGYRTFDQIRDA